MKSEMINELAGALSKAQAKIQNAIKDSINPFFESTYADLTSVWTAARNPLTENGLSVTQVTGIREDGRMYLETFLFHSSGQFISGMYLLNPTKNDPQGMGSAMTYARRYALAAICGISQADDDGNEGSKQTKVGEKTNPQKPAAHKNASEQNKNAQKTPQNVAPEKQQAKPPAKPKKAELEMVIKFAATKGYNQEKATEAMKGVTGAAMWNQLTYEQLGALETFFAENTMT